MVGFIIKIMNNDQILNGKNQTTNRIEYKFIMDQVKYREITSNGSMKSVVLWLVTNNHQTTDQLNTFFAVHSFSKTTFIHLFIQVNHWTHTHTDTQTSRPFIHRTYLWTGENYFGALFPFYLFISTTNSSCPNAPTREK